MTKIVCISDIHEAQDEIEDILPPGDLLLIAGDLTYHGTVQALQKFNNWVGRVKNYYGYKKVVMVPGNHDFLFEKDQPLARTIMSNAVVLINEPYVFNGLKIWGSPVTPWFHDWAFNHHRGPDIKRFWDIIPEDTDILITHGPPHMVRDMCRNGNVGCADLALRIKELKNLKLHVFGHIHEGYGEQNGSDFHGIPMTVKFVNPSIMDGWYNPVNKPIVVEL